MKNITDEEIRKLISERFGCKSNEIFFSHYLDTTTADVFGYPIIRIRASIRDRNIIYNNKIEDY